MYKQSDKINPRIKNIRNSLSDEIPATFIATISLSEMTLPIESKMPNKKEKGKV